MPRPSDAKSRMIRAAAALFRQRGYDGVGLSEILAASASPKGSFYHHFPRGKEELAEATVGYAGSGIDRLLDRCMAEATDLYGGLRRFADEVADWFEKTGCCEGCPVASIALDAAPQSASITAALRAVFDGWEERLVAHARRFGDRTFSGADAEHLIMLMEGAWVIARVRQSGEPIRRAAVGFLAGLAGDRS